MPVETSGNTSLTAAEQERFRKKFGPRGLPRPWQVPPDLIHLKRWVGFKKVGDKKPPHSPVTGELIGPSMDWERHFLTFEEARKGVIEHKLDGVGFVFGEGEGYVGIDFDNCITKKPIDETHTELVIHPEVVNWLRWFSTTYAEISPSQTGLHVLCRGKIRKSFKKTDLPNGGGSVEVYDRGRYFTFTGRHLGAIIDNQGMLRARLDINECQISLDKLITYLGGNKPSASEPVSGSEHHAWTVASARAHWHKILDEFRAMKRPEDFQNDKLNECGFFAGQAFAAGVFNETDKQLQQTLRDIGNSTPYCTGVEYHLNRSWAEGLTKPLEIMAACTDIGNAERFVLRHGQLVRYVKAYGDRLGWYVWDGHHWKPDSLMMIRKWAHETARAILEEAATKENTDDRKRLAIWATKSESSHSIDSMLNEAKPYLTVEPRDLDADPELLNLENGTLDLRSGEVLPQRPEDLITRMLPVHYDPKAACPKFEEHMALVLPDPTTRDYFQEMTAYNFSGSTAEQCIHILHGGGENGKSTTIDLFRNLAGDYGWPAPRALFAGGYQDIAPHQIADLVGRRFVTCSEFKKGDTLRVEVMKALTSGDSSELNGCRKYGHAFSFRPQAKFTLDSNFLLEVDSPDHGTWRRIRLIKFDQVISKVVKKDPHFDKKLWAERSGILNWIIAGLKRWNDRGRILDIPEAIARASQRYEEEQDRMEQFIAEQCERNPKLQVELSAFAGRFRSWLQDRGLRQGGEAVGRRAVKERLIEKGYIVLRDDKKRCDVVRGVALVSVMQDLSF